MDLRNKIKKIQRLVNVTADGIFGPVTANAVLASLAPADEPLTPPGDLDPRTLRNLATLEPAAQETMTRFMYRAKAIAAAMGVDAIAISGRRDKEEQNRVYESGASRARWTQSWHNYGTAIDLGLFDGATYLDSADPDRAWRIYAAIGAVADEFGLEWGGSWISFVDAPHFHIDFGHSTPPQTYRRALETGEWHYV